MNITTIVLVFFAAQLVCGCNSPENSVNKFSGSTKRKSFTDTSMVKTVWKGCCQASWNESRMVNAYGKVTLTFNDVTSNQVKLDKVLDIFYCDSNCTSLCGGFTMDGTTRLENQAAKLDVQLVDWKVGNNGNSGDGVHVIYIGNNKSNSEKVKTSVSYEINDNILKETMILPAIQAGQSPMPSQCILGSVK